MAFNKVPLDVFNRLERHYTKLENHEGLRALLKKKLYISSDEESMDIIRKIMSVTPIDDFEQNYFAIRALELSSVEEFKSRLKYYDLLDAHTDYFDILERALDLEWPREEKEEILRKCYYQDK